MSLKRRLQRAEWQLVLALAAEAGAGVGLTGEEVLDEARQFFCLPLDAQLAEVNHYEAVLREHGFTDANLAHMRKTLIQHYRAID